MGGGGGGGGGRGGQNLKYLACSINNMQVQLEGGGYSQGDEADVPLYPGYTVEPR